MGQHQPHPLTVCVELPFVLVNRIHSFPSARFLALSGAGLLASLSGLGAFFLGSDEHLGERPGSFVSRSGGKLLLEGSEYAFGGANIPYLRYVSASTVDDALRSAAAHGFRVVRVFGFVDTGRPDGSGSVDLDREGVRFHYWDGTQPVYNDGPDGLRRLDYVIYRAGRLGLRLIVPFTNNWRWGGGMDQYVQWRQARYHDEFYSDPTIRHWYKDYVAHLLNRVNTYTGTIYKNDPTILAWQLANEPQCRGNGPYPASPNCGPDLIGDWIGEMARHVKQIDPNHLLGTGDWGYYCQEDGTHWTEDCSFGVDTVRFHEVPEVDFVGFHLYLAEGTSGEWALDWISRHLRLGRLLNKPVVMDEFGWNREASRDAAYTDWMRALDEGGGGGHLFWMLGARRPDGQPGFDSEYTVYCPSPSCATLSRQAGDISGAVPQP